MKILVVDDAELNREILSDMLKDDYEVEMAEDGGEVFKIMEDCKEQISLIILDLHMPKVDGFAVLREAKKKGWIKKIPILVISEESSEEAERHCLELGVADFIRRPFNGKVVKNRIRNTIDLYASKNKLEDRVAEQTETLNKQCRILRMQAEKLKKNNERIIEILGTVVENRNLESGQHIKRVKGLTKILARRIMKDYPEYGLDDAQIEKIVYASSLHDIGKIAISDKVLLKPGKLTDEEFEYMKSHTTKGCEIINSIEDIWDDDYRQTCYEICRHHHERYDGKGYPDGLKGDDIPISAQIVSIADVYDALVHERVYKDAIPKEEAYNMIIQGECGIFSPKLMECFRRSKTEFEKMADMVL